jgi:hypothetical protein
VQVPLTELLTAHLRVEDNPVVKAIFGTDEPESVAAMIEGCAEEQLGIAVAGGLFYRASSGCVIGLHLADGTTAVVKNYQPHWELDFLRAVQRVQQAVFNQGFPCPAPLGGPVPIGEGWATFESYLPDPGSQLAGDPHALERSSNLLALLVSAAAPVDPSGLELHPFRIAPGNLYPTPHNPVFDLESTGAGAEWIDELARAAWARRHGTGLSAVIGHLDWSANNVRLGPADAVIVYDWDSLSPAPLAVVAGQAAATWRSTGESGDLMVPDAVEVDQFIRLFAAARGTPFSPSEIGVARGAAVWVMAYSARCEHALELRTAWKRTRARQWLRTQGENLL